MLILIWSYTFFLYEESNSNIWWYFETTWMLSQADVHDRSSPSTCSHNQTSYWRKSKPWPSNSWINKTKKIIILSSVCERISTPDHDYDPWSEILKWKCGHYYWLYTDQRLFGKEYDDNGVKRTIYAKSTILQSGAWSSISKYMGILSPSKIYLRGTSAVKAYPKKTFNIGAKTDFKVSFIKPTSIIRCVRKTDDIMSDDIIVDYIIRKMGKRRCWFTYLLLKDELLAGFDDLK